MNITTNMEDKMSDSNKKYTELYEKALENKLIEKGFGEKDSHDEEHVMKVVCKHFDMELTDEWTTDCDHYIYEENTSDGYTVYVSTHDLKTVNVSENVYYYDNDLAKSFKQAIYDNDHGDVKIYLSMLHDSEYWIQDAINDIYLELVELYTDTCKDELTEEDFVEPDMLLMLANNE
jgi:hypothetical protein